MIDNSVLKLDGKTYLVIDTILQDDFKYVYFMNEADSNDIFVRKEIEEEEETRYLVGLSDEQEFITAMKLFQDKHQ